MVFSVGSGVSSPSNASVGGAMQIHPNSPLKGYISAAEAAEMDVIGRSLINKKVSSLRGFGESIDFSSIGS